MLWYEMSYSFIYFGRDDDGYLSAAIHTSITWSK